MCPHLWAAAGSVCSVLTELGIPDSDERVYRELLHRPDATDLAEVLEMDHGDLSAALDRLAEAGFVVRADGAVRPVPPAAAIRTLVHRQQSELHERAAMLERAHVAADDLATRILASVPGPVPDRSIETVVGRPEIARRVGEIVTGAADEILVLDRPPYARPGRPRNEQELLERGVAIRVVFSADGLDLPGRMASIRDQIEAGLQARAAVEVPTKLVIVDRRIAVLPPSNVSDPTESALIVREALLLNALVPLFEATWARATPIGASEETLDPDDRLLLALLASGLKDEAVGRQLGVHVHTARRRISRMLGRLDAASRFQAGVHAVRRGWLES